ncbi:phospholipase/carboxylesterase [Indibacter alkaliphilus LW1]|uniref:Phospholipase/carboxylesterase n=1 Tax=Indibacter alkaliphilus (strain CCUG 57479 / KCTC 22604 / LW1) TaxID=1189612 RepID=S2DR52_INDAL|nr:dienelactone hydrolase family protein [Indibacter alkaliphilus]EOZ99755.1 phospholipase/carboxylesterase [Indibacter alkaliphilus LW1]
MSKVLREGRNLEDAQKVAIMIHGRGGTAESILSLKDSLNLKDFALLAPQAPENTWYPYSFMAPDKSNEPSFSQSIKTIDEMVNMAYSHGYKSEQIFFIGFSQGACLALEYATQNAGNYGGVIAFTGGLIGENIREEKYSGDFKQAKVFIGSGFKDPHVPLSRIEASEKLMTKLGAVVKTLIFEDYEHTIRKKEIDWVNENIL